MEGEAAVVLGSSSIGQREHQEGVLGSRSVGQRELWAAAVLGSSSVGQQKHRGEEVRGSASARAA